MNLINKTLIHFKNFLFNLTAIILFALILAFSPIYKILNKSKIKKFKQINIKQSSYWENRP